MPFNPTVVCLDCESEIVIGSHRIINGICDSCRSIRENALDRMFGDGMCKVLPLSAGRVAVVDTDDYERASQFKWSLKTAPSPRRDGKINYYAERRPSQHTYITLHGFIMSCQAGQIPDHINRDGLDNRRANLRIASTVQNAANRGPQINNTTGFKGVVVRNKKSGIRYVAAIQIEGQMIHLGTFFNPEDAARRYDMAAREAWGEFAFTNFQQTT